jgi:sec-independent protein translocase protein TatC
MTAELPAPEGTASNEVEEYRMSLLEHLVELRDRLIKAGAALLIATGVCLPFGDEIFTFLIAPTDGKFPEGSGFIYTELAEKFITDLKVSLFAAFFIAAPLLFGQLWGFISPGLYKKERRALLPFAFFSTLFFASGAAFCYFAILDIAVSFFLQFAASGEIAAQIKVSAYLRFVTRFMLAFGFVFELPLAIFFLARLGLVTAKGLGKFRPYAIIVAFVVGAMLTPPDPLSQAALAVPMIILYEVGIVTAKLWGRERASIADDEEQAAEAGDEEKADEEKADEELPG